MVISDAPCFQGFKLALNVICSLPRSFGLTALTCDVEMPQMVTRKVNDKPRGKRLGVTLEG